MRLTENPHQFAKYGFGGHIVRFQNTDAVFEFVARAVDGHIAAFVLHLCGHHDGFARVDRIGNHFGIAVFGQRRNTPHPIAFDDHGIIAGEHIRQHIGVHTGCEFEQGNVRIQPVVENRLCGLLRADILQNLSVPYDGKVRIINGGKRLQALRACFPGAGAENHFPAEDDLHTACRIGGGIQEAVEEICFGVGDFAVDGLLRARDDDGFRGVLHKVGDCRGGIRHGIGAVAYDKAVVAAVVFADGIGEAQPYGGGDVRAVDIAELERVHFAEFRNARDVFEDFVGGQLRGQTVCRRFRGNRAARADH